MATGLLDFGHLATQQDRAGEDRQVQGLVQEHRWEALGALGAPEILDHQDPLRFRDHDA